MALSRSLQALDAHLAEKNRELVAPIRFGSRWAPLAPMPADPTVCRWCGGQLRALMDGDPVDYCQQGCAKNTEHPYVGHCEECRREFDTGKRNAVLCAECDSSASIGQPVNEPPRPHDQTYAFSRVRRGGYRP